VREFVLEFSKFKDFHPFGVPLPTLQVDTHSSPTPARYKVLGFLDLELQAEKSEREV